MEHLVRMGLLFDFYGELLTVKQRRVFIRYYMDNLSLAEIAEEEEITRQAVHDLLQRTEHHLERWEEKLNLFSRFTKKEEYFSRIKASVEEVKRQIPVKSALSTEILNLQNHLAELESFLKE